MVKQLEKIHIFFMLLSLEISTAQPLNETTNGESTSSTSSEDRVYDCTLSTQRVATGLSIILLIETCFIILMLYQWIKRPQITSPNRQRKLRNIKKMPQFWTKFKSSSQSTRNQKDVEHGTDKNMANKEKADNQPINSHLLEESNRKDDKEPINEHFYHVLEEPECTTTQVTHDGLYYCSDDLVEVLEPRTQAYQPDKLYYLSDDLIDKVFEFDSTSQAAQDFYSSASYMDQESTQGTPNSQPNEYKMKSSTSIQVVKLWQRFPRNVMFKSRSKQSEISEAATHIENKSKSGLKANVIQEMKTKIKYEN